MASNVEKRMALTRPFFNLDKLTLATPTFSDSSFRDIFLSAITRSNLKMIGMMFTSQCFVGFNLQLDSIFKDIGQEDDDAEGDDEVKIHGKRIFDF